MYKIAKIRSQPPNKIYFVELKLTVSLSVLPSTESLKIAIITLIVPYLSLSITRDRKKIIMLFSYLNGIKIRINDETYTINPYSLFLRPKIVAISDHQ